MPSVRFWNSGGPPRTRLEAIVSPPALLLPLEPELAELLPDCPHAVSAVTSTAAPASALTIPVLRLMVVSPGSAAGRQDAAGRGDPGGGRRPGQRWFSPGRPRPVPGPGRYGC